MWSGWQTWFQNATCKGVNELETLVSGRGLWPWLMGDWDSSGPKMETSFHLHAFACGSKTQDESKVVDTESKMNKHHFWVHAGGWSEAKLFHGHETGSILHFRLWNDGIPMPCTSSCLAGTLGAMFCRCCSCFLKGKEYRVGWVGRFLDVAKLCPFVVWTSRNWWQ